MPKFPKSELEIIALAESMIEGLTRMTADFPEPPVPVSEMIGMLTEYKTVVAAGNEAEMMLRQQNATKNKLLERIEDGTKADLGYAEIAVRKDAGKLAGLGWGPRRDKTPLAAPGEVRDIGIVKQGPGWISLKWHAPVNGGTPAAYDVQRQEPNGDWEAAGTSATTDHVVANQARGVELNFRVIAVNRAGSGAPSGVVTAVL